MRQKELKTFFLVLEELTEQALENQPVVLMHRTVVERTVHVLGKAQELCAHVEEVSML